jgi:hypothetical protein
MKRTSFLKACLATSTFIASPFSLVAKSVKNFRAEKGFKIGAGKDRFDKSISLLEGDMFFSKCQQKILMVIFCIQSASIGELCVMLMKQI